MYPAQPPTAPQSASSDTATSDPLLVKAVEYHCFVEFCAVCHEFRSIGLCYGAPGIGKALSALRYSRAEMIVPRDRWTSEVSDELPIDTLLYTTSAINTPSRVESDINMAREKVMSIVLDPMRREAAAVLEAVGIPLPVDTNWFQTLPGAKLIIELRRCEYNESHPHRGLADRTPAEFASQITASRDPAETKIGRELTL